MQGLSIVLVSSAKSSVLSPTISLSVSIQVKRKENENEPIKLINTIEWAWHCDLTNWQTK